MTKRENPLSSEVERLKKENLWLKEQNDGLRTTIRRLTKEFVDAKKNNLFGEKKEE